MTAVEWTPEQAALGMKRCTKCKAVKPVSDFVRRLRSPSGVGSWCKACHTATYKVSSTAANMARCRLVAAHKAEYDRYYAEEKARLEAER